MRIKKYTAPSMRHALLQIKEELGDEAVILKTRRLPRKIFSLNQEDEVEVTAAIDDEVAPNAPTPPLRVADPGVYKRPVKPAPEVPQWARKPPEPPAPLNADYVATRPRISTIEPPTPPQMPAAPSPELLELKEDVRSLKDLVASVIKGSVAAPAVGRFTGGWGELYKRLTDAEVIPAIASDLIASIQGSNEALDPTNEKQLLAILATKFPSAGPIKLHNERPVRIAFVGPTGAGKTTTLAKLAAHLMVNRKKQVSIITADTYRIAAIEQIRTFADIVNAGLQVVFTPEEVPGALESCENDDVIFIDTAGRSRRNDEHMDHLEKLLAALKPDETHLVLSATTKDSDLLATIERYRGIGADRLLFTKLDETSCLGNLLNAVSRSAIPVSYFTFGQSIPDDIELAQPGRFLQRLWEGLRP